MRTRNLIPTTLAIAALALTGCASTTATEPVPTATVTVTAEPAQESPAPSPAATHSQSVTTPEEAQVAAGAPPADEYTPPAPVEPEGSYFGGEGSMVASVDMVGDDVTIVLKTSSEANATQTHAPYVLQEAIDNLTGSEHAPQIDLVAVYSSDGVMVASGRVPGA